MKTGTSLHFQSVEFHNFKALSRLTLRMEPMNILVGANNSGKSTIISAFRCLDVALRHARSHAPETSSAGRRWRIPENHLPISLENLRTDYSDEDASVAFSISGSRSLTLHFPGEGGCHLLEKNSGPPVSKVAQFKATYPLTISQVPVLGPVEQEEKILDKDYVKQSFGTRRASRHFRNHWHHFREGFETFATMVATSWPGMTISPPEVPNPLDRRLAMFCQEDRIAREIGWAGFGFQVWCQLLSHIHSAAGSTLLVVDEPEIYLHPELQRQLLSILRGLGPSILLATHSSEIAGDADPSEIVTVDKRQRKANRLRDIQGVQTVLDSIGSVHNITLAQLARTRKIVFIEGDFDFKILRRFAARLGLQQLAAGHGLTPIESEGFSNWEKVRETAWGIEKCLSGEQLQIAAVFDRDYRSDEEIDEICSSLRREKAITIAHIHRRKELENYLLEPGPLGRALERAARERAEKTHGTLAELDPITDILTEICEELKDECMAQWLSFHEKFSASRNRKADSSTHKREAIKTFNEKWSKLESRIFVVPGKEVLKRVRDHYQTQHHINLTDARLIDAFHRDEVPEDLISLLHSLDRFRGAEG